MSPANKKHVIIGKVYADWCPHCKSLKPEWKKMKKQLKLEMGRSIRGAQIDIVEIGDEKSKAAGKTVGIAIDEFNMKHLPNVMEPEKKLVSSGFPTVFKLCDGNIEYYQGNMTAKELYAWATSDCLGKVQTPQTKHVNFIVGGGRKSRKALSKGRKSQSTRSNSRWWFW